MSEEIKEYREQEYKDIRQFFEDLINVEDTHKIWCKHSEIKVVEVLNIFNWYKELQQENQQLKLTNQALSGCLKIDKEKIDYYVDRCEQLEKILDEIREYSLDLHLYDNESLEFKISNELLQILDKVKE